MIELNSNMIKRAFVLFSNNVYKLFKGYISIYLFIGILYLFAKNDVPPLYLKELFTEINFWNIVNNSFLLYVITLLILEDINLYHFFENRKIRGTS